MWKKNVYFDVLNDIVDKYNKTYHSSIKMNLIDIKVSFYTEYKADSNAKDAKYETDDQVRISQYKNNFAKGFAPNWSEEAF